MWIHLKIDYTMSFLLNGKDLVFFGLGFLFFFVFLQATYYSAVYSNKYSTLVQYVYTTALQ